MQVLQRHYRNGQWSGQDIPQLDPQKTLLLVFGQGDVLVNKDRWQEVQDILPGSTIVAASTSGEIIGTQVHDGTIVVTALSFQSAHFIAKSATVATVDQTYETVKNIAAELPKEELRHVLAFSDGLFVNGSDLAKGILSVLPEGVTVTGGMAGDADKFGKTYSGLNELPSQNKVVIVGLYGPLYITHGSFGGWDPFGIPRLVTKSSGNVVYELDHEPILDLYKKYLGPLAAELPASGLLFPLNISEPGGDTHLVRTLLSVNEQDKSITYAGDVPEGNMAQLMKANFNRLIEGAEHAAQNAYGSRDQSPDFALLISCVGRKLVLKDRIEEEIEAVRQIMGEATALGGFYSYGEIAPEMSQSAICELHNQTMTITTITEHA